MALICEMPANFPKKISWDLIAKIFKNEFFLFGFVFLLLGVKFSELFKAPEIPSWDIPLHFIALQKMTEYLSRGGITGYFLEWFGGIQLFDFYAPLYFIVVAIIWFITFKIIPLIVLFRVSIFLLLLSFVFCFWYFLKTFFGRETAKWGILSSLVFIFYPQELGITGVGAAGLITLGLIPNLLGLNLALLWLSFTEKLRLNPRSVKIFAFSTLSFSALVLSHTLNFIGGAFLFLIYLIYYRHNKAFLKNILLSSAIAISLTSFWLIPFVLNLDITSSATNDLSIDPFFLLFPLNEDSFLNIPNQIEKGTLPWGIILLAFTTIGLFRLVKYRFYLFPIFFLFLLFVIDRNYFSTIFPSVSIHYIRLIAITFIISLAIATYTISELWKITSSKILLRGTLAITITALFASPIMSFNNHSVWQKGRDIEEGQKVADFFKSVNDAERIFVQETTLRNYPSLGSPHYLSAKLSEQNKSLITGLYAESSPMTPYIMATINALTESLTLAWGDDRLLRLEYFYEQNIDTHLDRLKYIGVNYLVVSIKSVVQKLKNAAGVKTVFETERFTVFKIDNPRPYIYKPSYLPALYLNEDGKIPFKELEIASFSSSEIFDFPIAEWNMPLKNLKKEFLDQFSLLIVSGSNLGIREIYALRELGHPIVVLNPSSEAEELEIPFVYFVPKFFVLEKGSDVLIKNMPSSWKLLEKIMSAYKAIYKLNPEEAKVEKITGKEITFEGKGSYTLNFGYSPYWQTTPKNNQVFKAGPGQMLVFADGKTTLRYSPNLAKKAAGGISILTLAAFLVYVFRRRD